MTKSLTTLISNIQALFLDDGTRYSTATLTAAVRAALKEFNQRAPEFAGDLVDVVDELLEYSLNATTYQNLIEVVSVLKQGTDTYNDNNIELPFDFYRENGGPSFRLRAAEASGYLMVRFSIPYTVSGLDSAIESTLPAFYDDILIDGACFWALQIRSVGRVETINLNSDVSKNLLDAKRYFRQAFDAGLALAARGKPPVSEPSTAAWNDQWKGWNV